jgi:hypothetical protein
LGLWFGDDRQDFDGRVRYIVKHPNIADAKTILRPRKTTKALDPAAADFARLLSQMRLEGGSHKCADIGFEIAKIINGFRCKHDGERHYGQNIARIDPGQRAWHI